MRLPVLSGKALVRALEHAGFEVSGQRGSHVKLKKRSASRVIVTIVPMHDELDAGTLLGILRQAEISREELAELLV